MQPYLYPYLLYFHLIAAVDVFVLFDCVQFPRRGRVHRAPLPDGKWLTLPLAKQPRDTHIANLGFAAHGAATWASRCDEHDWLSPDLREVLAISRGESVNGFLRRQLEHVCSTLEIQTTIVESSALNLPEGCKSQDRVMAAAKAVGGKTYVNLPGGRDLYDPQVFARHGLDLTFLEAYSGPHMSMLHSLSKTSIAEMQSDLRKLPSPTVATP